MNLAPNIDRAREYDDARQIEAIHADAPELTPEDEADLLADYIEASKAIGFDRKLSDIDYDVAEVLAKMTWHMRVAFQDALNVVHAEHSMKGDV